MTGITPEQKRILKPILKPLEKEQQDKVTEAVAAATEAHANYFLSESIIGMRQREKRAWAIGITGLVAGIVGIAMGTYGLVKNETQAYLAIVDKDTGVVERGVTVERATVSQKQAVVESLIHSYVLDRETYDIDDNEYRILSVFQRSAPNVRQEIEGLWTAGHTLYPPDVYGLDGRVTVTINNMIAIDDDTMQVRFTKELRRPNTPDQAGDFVATVTYRFDPSTVQNNLLLWQNPFGFQVTGYRVASEGTSQ